MSAKHKIIVVCVFLLLLNVFTCGVVISGIIEHRQLEARLAAIMGNYLKTLEALERRQTYIESAIERTIDITLKLNTTKRQNENAVVELPPPPPKKRAARGGPAKKGSKE